MYYCQATKSEPAEVVVRSESPDGPYRLSAEAAERLKNFCLRPAEWYNLAVIHGPFEVLLHDDFYDENGVASQQKEEVVDADLYPAPTLADVADALEGLLDFASTRWWLREEVIAALRHHSPAALLASIMRRVQGTKNPWFRQRYYDICGEVLKGSAEGWVRQQLDSAAPEEQLDILRGAAECLPTEDGLEIAVNALASRPGSESHGPDRLVLAAFQHRSVLGWIERHVPKQSAIDGYWGDLAAASNFDWSTAARWLKGGRPLSLVALDALWACDSPRPGQSQLMRRLAPKLKAPPAESEAVATLRDYAAKDPVPRVTAVVDRIIERFENICDQGERRESDRR